jgi:hypothetical protein
MTIVWKMPTGWGCLEMSTEKDSEEQGMIEEYNRFMDEWEKRPTNRELYGNNCYRPDEVALTDEEYELFG